MTDISIPVDDFLLNGILEIPPGAVGIVLFAHGSGSSRLSQRNQYVASVLNQAKIATLLFDLLTVEEERVDELTRLHRFNIELLAGRLRAATAWTMAQAETKGLMIGYFGASTGGAAAMLAASYEGDDIKAIVSRGGRPDLAGDALRLVKAPTLLIVGGHDEVVIQKNHEAMAYLSCTHQLQLVPGATHLFEEPGTLELVAELARNWFIKYLHS